MGFVHKSDLMNFIQLGFVCLLGFRIDEFCLGGNFWLHKVGMELSLKQCVPLHYFLNELLKAG